MFDPGQRLPEEQEYVQAYESVREKYKGNNSILFSSLIRHRCGSSESPSVKIDLYLEALIGSTLVGTDVLWFKTAERAAERY